MGIRNVFLSAMWLLSSSVIMAQRPPVSDGVDEHWFHIVSAASESGELVMTDDGCNVDFPIGLKLLEEGNALQCWKLVESGPDGLVSFVNSGTGRVLQPRSIEVSGLYRVTQLGEVPADGCGFELEELSDGQYAICGLEADGVVRYLACADQDEALPSVYSATANSVYSWIFAPALYGGLDDVHMSRNEYVSVVNGRIYVYPGIKFRVFTLSGMEMDADKKLSPGVYVVDMEQGAVKVMVGN